MNVNRQQPILPHHKAEWNCVHILWNVVLLLIIRHWKKHRSAIPRNPVKTSWKRKIRYPGRQRLLLLRKICAPGSRGQVHPMRMIRWATKWIVIVILLQLPRLHVVGWLTLLLIDGIFYVTCLYGLSDRLIDKLSDQFRWSLFFFFFDHVKSTLEVGNYHFVLFHSKNENFVQFKSCSWCKVEKIFTVLFLIQIFFVDLFWLPCCR